MGPEEVNRLSSPHHRCLLLGSAPHLMADDGVRSRPEEVNVQITPHYLIVRVGSASDRHVTVIGRAPHRPIPSLPIRSLYDEDQTEADGVIL